MSPDDPRHGTNAGYHRCKLTGQACQPCTRAAAKYEQTRQLRLMRGETGRLPLPPYSRRLQALARLGYNWKGLGREIGSDEMVVRNWAYGRQAYIFPDSAARIADVYERLSARPAPARDPRERRAATIARRNAERNGWLPPLAWDDIDAGVRAPYIKPVRGHDHAIVERIIGGDWHLARTATISERNAVHDRWIAAGRSIRQLTELTGWEFRPKKGDAA